jgi:pheromone alpha factor receptor
MIALALIDQTKLRRPIFVLNIVNLFLASSRAMIFAILRSGPFQGFAQEFLGAPGVDADIFEGLVIFGVLIQLFLYASIIATLGLQVRVVFSTTKTKRWQRCITIILSIAGLVLLGFESAYVVFYIMFVLAEEPVPVWVITTVRVLFIVFVGTCSLAFLYKLATAIHQRRRIGIAKFGPLQILFIMSCQCLIAPRKSAFLLN